LGLFPHSQTSNTDPMTWTMIRRKQDHYLSPKQTSSSISEKMLQK